MTSLPRMLLLTDGSQASAPLWNVLDAAIGAGVRAVVLREHRAPAAERAALAVRLKARLSEVDGTLVVGLRGDPPPGLDPHGWHLSATAPPLDAPGALVGRSCHGRAELAAARAEGVDYVTVSPVGATRSKPGYGPALGIRGLAELCVTASPPVYALGGIETADDVRTCLAAGAYGVAVMGAVMRADEPGRLCGELLDALG